MKDFTIAIAEKKIAISALFGSSERFCRDYLSEGEAELAITVTTSDLKRESILLQKTAEQDDEQTELNPPSVELLAILRKLSEGLLEHQTLLMHGSAIALDGEGYLFTAPSGTGKSTHTRLWREHFGSRAVMVNDDKPFIKLTDESVLVCGTPWCGKHGLNTNICVPLKAICILERGEENHIEKISAIEALPVLLNQVYRPDAPKAMEHMLDIVEQLSSRVSLYRLRCNMDPEAAVAAYQGMGGKEV